MGQRAVYFAVQAQPPRKCGRFYLLLCVGLFALAAARLRAIASLICGVCWETWNYFAYAKWVYAVPWVHRFQIWEMPLIGFGGYLPFGVECAAVTAWILPALVENDEDGSC